MRIRNWGTLLFILLVIPIVSANGLQITPNSIQVNQTHGIPIYHTFVISNTDVKDFTNISFQQTSIMSVTPFDLASGQNKTINATINALSSFNGEVRLQGHYLSNQGQQNLNYSVNIFSNNYSISPCSLTILQGDSITWHYDGVSPVNLDLVGGGTITTNFANTDYTAVFNNPTQFTYYVAVNGGTLQLSPNQCTVTVLSTTGYVNDPELDGIVTVNDTVIYPATTIVPTFLSTSYTLNEASIQDIFKITNSGSETAYNVHLSGNWMTFSINDFTLAPGQSQNVGLTISLPTSFKTEDTNKTYYQTLGISGNFQQVNQNISIFIPYLNIGSSFFNSTVTLEEVAKGWLQSLQAYCNSNPNSETCKNFLNAITGIISGSNSTSSSDIIQLAGAIYTFMNSQGQFNEKFGKALENINSTVSNNSLVSKQTDEKVSSVSNDVNSSNITTLILIIIICFVVSLVTIVYVVDKHNKKKQREKYQKYY